MATLLCQIKPQRTYSSAIQHRIMVHMAVLEWFWAGGKLESYFGNKPPGSPLPTLCLSIYKCMPLVNRWKQSGFQVPTLHFHTISCFTQWQASYSFSAQGCWGVSHSRGHKTCSRNGAHFGGTMCCHGHSHLLKGKPTCCPHSSNHMKYAWYQKGKEGVCRG